jgi:hypothetical protein
MEVSSQLYAPAALFPGEEPRYPSDRRLGGPQSRYGRGVKEKNSQPREGLEPRSSWLPTGKENVREDNTATDFREVGLFVCGLK